MTEKKSKPRNQKPRENKRNGEPRSTNLLKPKVSHQRRSKDDLNKKKKSKSKRQLPHKKLRKRKRELNLLPSRDSERSSGDSERSNRDSRMLKRRD